jgi:hypothetical protein
MSRDTAAASQHGIGEAAGQAPHTIFYDDGRCVMATYKNVSVFVWGTQATLALAEHVASVAEQLRRSYPGGNSTVHVILKDVGLPEPDVRAKLRALTERYAYKLACNAAVIEGGGFWASAMRGLITSFHWLQGRRFKSRTCGTLEEVAAWMPEPHLEMTSVEIDPAELLTALRSLRQRIG